MRDEELAEFEKSVLYEIIYKFSLSICCINVSGFCSKYSILYG